MKWEYGNLRLIVSEEEEKTDWVFIGKDTRKILPVESVVKALNYLGNRRWELIYIDEQIGYVFKRER